MIQRHHDMIFYFSGTGNSLWVAKRIQNRFGGKLISIAEEMKNRKGMHEYQAEEGIPTVFVMPVHSWGPAPMMMDFISGIRISGTGRGVYAVLTCGDNCGQADMILRKALKERSLRLRQIWSVQMPNNFILMKGFGTDDSLTEYRKLSNAPETVDNIIYAMEEGKHYPHYVKGRFPFLKSRLIYPAFRKFVIGSTSGFRVTEKCIGCGQCSEICPAGCIEMVSGKPQWNGKGCVQCTACINRCPAMAIEYGKVTINSGRYVHPDLK